MSFNVGDRVRTGSNAGPAYRGLLATVVDVNRFGSHLEYHIEIDADQPRDLSAPDYDRRDNGGVWTDDVLNPAFEPAHRFENNDPELYRLPKGTLLTRRYGGGFEYFVNGDGTFTLLREGHQRRLGLGRRVEGDEGRSDLDYWVTDNWIYVGFDLSRDPHAEAPLQDWERDLLVGRAVITSGSTVYPRIDSKPVTITTTDPLDTEPQRPLAIGDRVVVNGRQGNPDYRNQKGTIVSGSPSLQFRVEFDNTGERVGDSVIFDGSWSPENLDLVTDEETIWLVGQRVWHKTVSTFGTVVDSEPDETLLEGAPDNQVTVLWDDESVLNAAPHNLISEGDRLRALLAEQVETSAMHEAVAREGQEEIERLEADNEKLRDQIARTNERGQEQENALETLRHELDRANERVEEFSNRETKAVKALVYVRQFVSDDTNTRLDGFIAGLNA